jgi:fructokinase
MENRVLVFGEALLDDFGSEQVCGGAPFNVARHLAVLGMPALLVTRLGADANGARLRAECARYGMATEGVQTAPHHPTGRVLVQRQDGQHRFTILPGQAYDYIDGVAAVDVLRAFSPDILYFGTLAQRAPTSRAALTSLLAHSEAERFLDLNLREGVDESVVFDSLQQADILKVNEDELQALFAWYCHTCPGTADMDCVAVEAECRALMHNFSLRGMLVTMGARGAMYLAADGGKAINHDVKPPSQLVDTVGAGDAFSAMFLHGRARGLDVQQALAQANAYAGAACGVAGAAPQV